MTGGGAKAIRPSAAPSVRSALRASVRSSAAVPRRLRAGSRVGVVAPSGVIDPERLEAGCEILRGWGLDVEAAPHLLDRHDTLDYLAGADSARAKDLEQAWLDPGIDAVLCARGGYGAQRIADLLDWPAMAAAVHSAVDGAAEVAGELTADEAGEVAAGRAGDPVQELAADPAAVPDRAEPKVLAGFSDITALHEAFAIRLGVATLHAPGVATQSFIDEPQTQEGLRQALFGGSAGTRVLTSPTAGCLAPGRAAGVTAGGTLSLLAANLGTADGRDAGGFAGQILLLEDVNEACYRLDRLLTQLLRAGALDGVAGIALGSWAGCGPLDDVRALMLDRLGPLGVPVAWELGFGHCSPQLTVPLGVPATLDADAGILTVPDLPEPR